MFSPVNYFHLVSLQQETLSAPSYRMITLESDFNWLPPLTDLPESFSHSRRYNVNYAITGDVSEESNVIATNPMLSRV